MPPKPPRPRISLKNRLAGVRAPGEPPTLRGVNLSELAYLDESEDAEIIYPISLKAVCAPYFAFYGFSLPKTRLEFVGVRDYISTLRLQLLARTGSRKPMGSSYFQSLEARYPGRTGVLELLVAGDHKAVAAINKAERRAELCKNAERKYLQFTGQRNPASAYVAPTPALAPSVPEASEASEESVAPRPKVIPLHRP